MKLKNIFSFFIIGLFLLSVVASAFASDVKATEEGLIPFVDSVVEYTGEFTGEHLNWLQKLIGADPLAFTTVEATKNSCSAVSNGGYMNIGDDGLNSQGQRMWTNFGSCNVGDHVQIYKCDSKSFGSCDSYFKELWFKKSASEQFFFSDYDISKSGQFYATYTCYECPFSSVETSYSCWNGEYRGEPNTEYEGIKGTCEAGCKKSSITKDTKSKSAVESAICKTVPVDDFEGESGDI